MLINFSLSYFSFCYTLLLLNFLCIASPSFYTYLDNINFCKRQCYGLKYYKQSRPISNFFPKNSVCEVKIFITDLKFFSVSNLDLGLHLLFSVSETLNVTANIEKVYFQNQSKVCAKFEQSFEWILLFSILSLVVIMTVSVLLLYRFGDTQKIIFNTLYMCIVIRCNVTGTSTK